MHEMKKEENSHKLYDVALEISLNVEYKIDNRQ